MGFKKRYDQEGSCLSNCPQKRGKPNRADDQTSAADNRPLKGSEFWEKATQTIFVSATPGNWELEQSHGQVVQQVIRPTGVLDPIVEVRPTEGQVDDLLGEIRIRADKNERVIITTLTKRMAEDLTDYLAENGVRVLLDSTMASTHWLACQLKHLGSRSPQQRVCELHH